MKNLLKNLFLFSFVYLALCLVFSCKKEGEGTFKIVFYPNESGESMKDAREAFKDILQKALEREVEVVTTTDYNIALETLISGKANMAYVGAEGYIQAHNKNKSVIPVATNSGASGTLSDSLYYAFIACLEKNKDEFIDLYFGESKLKKILTALKENNIEDFERIFQNILLNSVSTWDTSKEAFYHGLSFGMLSYLDGEYYVTSNFESGYGRYDIIAEPRNKNKRGFVIECKIVKDEKDLEKMSKEAIEQIKNKKYDTQLKERGIKEITLLGLAFCGKRMKVSYE